MNYTFMPSLKDRALVKVTAALWNQSDIRDLVAGCLTLCDPSTIHAGKWKEIEDKVIGKVPKLPLPALLQKEVLDLAQLMGLEVKKWKEYHGHRNRLLGVDVSAELCWTPQGTVDRKKTAEVLVKDERIDITTRYRFACHYCLENEVKELWNAMPGRKKDEVFDEENDFCEENTLTVLWTCYITDSSKCYDLIEERDRRGVSPYQFQFEHSAEIANKVATEYFLQKLTPREREECLIQCAMDLAGKDFFVITDTYDCNEGYDAETLCFLLSQMDIDQQFDVLEDNPAGVLLCLLDWPWQSFFMETANRVWGVLLDYEFELLLDEMVTRVMNGFNKCNYQKIFGEFWQQSPNNYKKYVAGRLTSEDLLPALFEIEDKENIRLIFKNVTSEERKEIIYSDKGMVICEDLIYRNKWDLLKFYLLECICISSEEMMCGIEEGLRSIVSKKSKVSPESENSLWIKFFEIRDDLHEDYEKRCMEKLNSNPAKRLKFE